MARDYKNTRTNRSSSGVSAWGGFTIGLLMGLAVATAVYIYDRRPSATLSGGAPVSSEKERDAPSSPTPESAQSGDSGTEFDFYEVLPKLEVEVGRDNNKSDGSSSAAGAIDAPGSYVLQVGSYRNFADADRVRARLAIQGIESNIQKISIDGPQDVWHRVRIGPINNLNRLEETRRKLREAQIDALVIKQGK